MIKLNNKTQIVLFITIIILSVLIIYNSISIASLKDVTYEKYDHPTDGIMDFEINIKTNHLLLGRINVGMEVIDLNSMSLITTIQDDFPKLILIQEEGDNIAYIKTHQKIIIIDQYNYHIISELLFNSTDSISSATWVPNQNKIIYQRMGLVNIWDIISDEITNTPISYPGRIIEYFKWDNNGEDLVTINTRGGIKLWAKDFSLLRTYPDVGKSIVFVEWINRTNLMIVYENGHIIDKNIQNGNEVDLFNFNYSNFMISLSQDKSRIVVSYQDKFEVYDLFSKTLISSFEYQEDEHEDKKENEGVIWTTADDSIISFNEDIIIVWESNFHLNNLDEIKRLESYGGYLIGMLIVNLTFVIYLYRAFWIKKYL